MKFDAQKHRRDVLVEKMRAHNFKKVRGMKDGIYYEVNGKGTKISTQEVDRIISELYDG